MNAKFRKIIEQWMTEITIIICLIIFRFLIGYLKIEFSGSLCENLISSANNISSIIIGFMGVLIGVLFTDSESRTIRGLITYRGKDLKRYILQPVLLGIIVIILGCIIMIIVDNEKYITLKEPLLMVWASLLMGLLISSWRIIRVIVCLVIKK